MKNQFTLFDIQPLKEHLALSSMQYDEVKPFLSKYDFQYIYETGDESMVFEAGGENNIYLEFFDFDHPIKRECSVLYWKNGKPFVLEL